MSEKSDRYASVADALEQWIKEDAEKDAKIAELLSVAEEMQTIGHAQADKLDAAEAKLAEQAQEIERLKEDQRDWHKRLLGRRNSTLMKMTEREFDEFVQSMREARELYFQIMGSGSVSRKEPKMSNDTRSDRIQSELDRVSERLRQEMGAAGLYCQLYAVQQALSWALNPEGAAAPFDVIVGGKVQPLTREKKLDDLRSHIYGRGEDNE